MEKLCDSAQHHNFRSVWIKKHSPQKACTIKNINCDRYLKNDVIIY